MHERDTRHVEAKMGRLKTEGKSGYGHPQSAHACLGRLRKSKGVKAKMKV